MNTPLRLTIFLLNSLCLNLLKRGKSVSRILYRLAEKTVAIIHLGDSLPNRSSDLPESVSRPKAGIRADHSQNAFLFGLAPRGVCLAASVTRCAGALLPHRFTHHPHSPKYLGRAAGWSALCCTCRHRFSNTDARALPGSLSCGVRTFLS